MGRRIEAYKEEEEEVNDGTMTNNNDENDACY